MSVDTTVVAQEVASPEETKDLFPGTTQLTLGGTPVTVNKMKVGKMLLALELVSELMEDGDLSSLVTGQLSQADIVQRIVPNLPKLIRTARPVLQRAVALIITPDRDLADLENTGVDMRTELESRGRVLFADADTGEVLAVLTAGIQALGIDALTQALPNLANAITPTTN